ncbi:hypothetical protein D9758_002161 [Tetrapyrgos nigripes]|uniref:Uncharacterized protein n=1 Tax=Tetrapyrgos nigripes TaxID=182062 RepID=A0A8H5LT29_9AGAR|nr:hypothetical protein D9758_002161 [Tetrapyrgos nigripes]
MSPPHSRDNKRKPSLINTTFEALTSFALARDDLSPTSKPSSSPASPTVMSFTSNATSGDAAASDGYFTSFREKQTRSRPCSTSVSSLDRERCTSAWGSFSSAAWCSTPGDAAVVLIASNIQSGMQQHK